MINFFSLITICLMTVFGLAQVALAEDANRLEEMKKEAIAGIDQRIQALEKGKTCITGASNMEAMKACHKDLRLSREEMRMEHLERRKEHLDERQKAIEERKKKLEEKK